MMTLVEDQRFLNLSPSYSTLERVEVFLQVSPVTILRPPPPRLLLAQACRRGIAGISLRVEDGNAARRLYERAGFSVVGHNGSSDTMLLSLR